MVLGSEGLGMVFWVVMRGHERSNRVRRSQNIKKGQEGYGRSKVM